MDISTGVQSAPECKFGIAGKRDEEALTFAPGQVEWDIVSPPNHMVANSRPGETIGVMVNPKMQTGNCFNNPKPIFPENERKI